MSIMADIAEAVRRPGEPPRKTDMVIECMRRGDYRAAVSIAHTFKLGMRPSQAHDIKRAYEAWHYPDFYRQLGRDPVQLIAKGDETLHEIYGERL